MVNSSRRGDVSLFDPNEQSHRNIPTIMSRSKASKRQSSVSNKVLTSLGHASQQIQAESVKSEYLSKKSVNS